MPTSTTAESSPHTNPRSRSVARAGSTSTSPQNVDSCAALTDDGSSVNASQTSRVKTSSRSSARVTLTRISRRAPRMSKSGGGGVARSGRRVSNRVTALSGRLRNHPARVVGTSEPSAGMDTLTTVSGHAEGPTLPTVRYRDRIRRSPTPGPGPRRPEPYQPGRVPSHRRRSSAARQRLDRGRVHAVGARRTPSPASRWRS